MTDTQAKILQLQTRIELYQFSLSQTRREDHAIQLNRAISITQNQIDQLLAR